MDETGPGLGGVIESVLLAGGLVMTFKAYRREKS
jgi:hypothetical protein